MFRLPSRNSTETVRLGEPTYSRRNKPFGASNSVLDRGVVARVNDGLILRLHKNAPLAIHTEGTVRIDTCPAKSLRRRIDALTKPGCPNHATTATSWNLTA